MHLRERIAATIELEQKLAAAKAARQVERVDVLAVSADDRRALEAAGAASGLSARASTPAVARSAAPRFVGPAGAAARPPAASDANRATAALPAGERRALTAVAQYPSA